MDKSSFIFIFKKYFWNFPLVFIQKVFISFKKHPEFFSLIGILILSFFLRFFQLFNIPPGLSFEESKILGITIDAKTNFTLLKANIPYSFLPVIFSLYSKMFGFKILGFRVFQVFLSIFVILGFYFLVKSFCNKKVALLGSFFLSFSGLYLTFSRNISPDLLMVFVLLVIFYLFDKLTKNPKNIYFGLLGFFLSFGFYIKGLEYFWFLIFLGFFSYLYFIFLNNPILKKTDDIKKVAIPVFIIFSLPFLIFLVRDFTLIREFFISSPIQFLVNFKNNLLIFNFKSPVNFFYNLGVEPLLDPLIGIAFLAGIFFILKTGVKKNFFWLFLFLAYLFASSFIKNPFSLLIFAVPSVFIISALGLIFSFDYLLSFFPLNKLAQKLIYLLFVVLAFLSFFYNYQRYFTAWAKSPMVYKTYNEDLVGISNFLKTISDKPKLLVLDKNQIDVTRVLSFQRFNFQGITLKDLDSLKIKDGIIITTDNQKFDIIKKRFPKSFISWYPSKLTKENLFYILDIKKDK